MVKRLFRRKFIHHILEEIDIEEHRLHRALNAFDLTILGIGAIVGVGIFVLTGNAAGACRSGRGFYPFASLGHCLCLAALCYAEFAALIPVAGKTLYNYAYANLGELDAWILAGD